MGKKCHKTYGKLLPSLPAPAAQMRAFLFIALLSLSMEMTGANEAQDAVDRARATKASEAGTQPQKITARAALDMPSCPPLEYPPASLRTAEQGTSQVLVRVDAKGQPASVELYKSSGFRRLDDAALSFARKCRFLPALADAMPVASETVVPIEWRLSPARPGAVDSP